MGPLKPGWILFKAKPQKGPVGQDTWTLGSAGNGFCGGGPPAEPGDYLLLIGRNDHHIEGGEPGQGRHHLLPESDIVLANAAGEGEHVDPAEASGHSTNLPQLSLIHI